MDLQTQPLCSTGEANVVSHQGLDIETNRRSKMQSIERPQRRTWQQPCLAIDARRKSVKVDTGEDRRHVDLREVMSTREPPQLGFEQVGGDQVELRTVGPGRQRSALGLLDQ